MNHEIEDADIQQAGDLHAILNETDHVVPMRALHERIERLYEHIGQASSEVDIVITTDEEIRALNREWRHVDEPTDVLSFPMREGESPEIAEKLPLGDIVISIETAERYVESCSHRDRLNAGPAPLTENWTLLDELTFLCIHSTLHLLGYDHAEPDEEREMRALEREWMLYILDSEK